jgi:hypothetical protein
MHTNKSPIKIYIDFDKPYYFPGEKFYASILLDVIETSECDKMQIIVKGKEIVKAVQKTYIDSFNDYSDTETNSNESSEDDERQYKRKKSRKKEESSSSEDTENDKASIARNLDETHKIFKYKKIVIISSENYIMQGKYNFPLEIEIPENIPGSFLFYEHNTYIEIVYSLKVKLNKINIKESIPIVIRQKEKIFNYPRTNNYTKILNGCCFETYESSIKLSTVEKYMINTREIKLNVVVNNKKNTLQASPISLEMYQKITIFPKNKNKKLKITRIVGKYKGKKYIPPRENYNKDISFLMDKSEYASEHLSKTKSIKHFRHKDVIPFLNQSIKSDFINCEYEIYVEVQFPNWSVEELGVFLPIIIYPTDKGILSKTISEISKEFINGIIKKKIFLDSKSNEESPDFESKKIKNRLYEETESEENDTKIGRKKSLLKVKSFGMKHKNENNIINKDRDDEEEEENENDVNNANNNLNSYQNYINNNQNHVINEDGSFGKYNKRKKNIVYIDNNSNNFKKDFNQDYLDDALDDEFLDKETNNK